MNPKAIGEISEGVVLAHLLMEGKSVSLPFGNNQRYDLIVDEGADGLVRAQVKTGYIEGGCVVFHTCSTNGFTGKRTDYLGGADIFLVYSPHTKGIYRLSVHDCGRSSTRLRVDPPKLRGHKSTIRWAADYQIN